MGLSQSLWHITYNVSIYPLGEAWTGKDHCSCCKNKWMLMSTSPKQCRLLLIPRTRPRTRPNQVVKLLLTFSLYGLFLCRSYLYCVCFDCSEILSHLFFLFISLYLRKCSFLFTFSVVLQSFNFLNKVYLFLNFLRLCYRVSYYGPIPAHTKIVLGREKFMPFPQNNRASARDRACHSLV